MFIIFPNRRTKLFTVLLAIIASWGFLIFAIYDASRPTEGVTGAIIQTIKTNPDLEKNFSSFANSPLPSEASPSASVSATPIY